MSERKKHIVCIASEHKGNEFLEECASAGWRTTLVTRRDLLDYSWLWDAVSDVKTVEKGASVEDWVRAVTNVAGEHPIDRIVGLDEFDVLNAARAREHLQLDGLSVSYLLRFRDKLQMRILAAANDLPCPAFVGAFNASQISEYLNTTDAPWIVKPRTEVNAFGIRKCDTAEQVWETLKGLDERHTWRDHPSQFLIEQFIAGKVYHVDSVVENGKIVAVGISEYGKPPMTVSHEGGVFTTSIVPYKSKERRTLETLNKKLLKAFDYERGVSHAEFLQSEATGEFYLLEVAARVGGAYIANVVEHGNGFNLWREWAKLEVATVENPYKSPKLRKDYAGITLALAKEDQPDTAHYNDDEIVYRVTKSKHVGLIFASDKHERVVELIETYTNRIAEDFLAVAPVKERYDD